VLLLLLDIFTIGLSRKKQNYYTIVSVGIYINDRRRKKNN
jgi:hypothetical protein